MPSAPGMPFVRIVADTNVLVSGSLWNGAPARILEAVEARRLTLVLSPELWAEFAAVLNRPKLASRIRSLGLAPSALAHSLRTHVEWTAPGAIKPPPGLRDPKDLPVLAAAVAGRVDAIVTGDGDLLHLGTFCGIPILAVEAMLSRIRR